MNQRLKELQEWRDEHRVTPLPEAQPIVQPPSLPNGKPKMTDNPTPAIAGLKAQIQAFKDQTKTLMAQTSQNVASKLAGHVQEVKQKMTAVEGAVETAVAPDLAEVNEVLNEVAQWTNGGGPLEG